MPTLPGEDIDLGQILDLWIFGVDPATRRVLVTPSGAAGTGAGAAGSSERQRRFCDLGPRERGLSDQLHINKYYYIYIYIYIYIYLYIFIYIYIWYQVSIVTRGMII